LLHDESIATTKSTLSDQLETESVHSDSLVQLRDVTKKYGETTVLDSLTFDVKAGEKVALIGPSGSGKTTVLRVIMGLEKPNAGTVVVAGDEIWRESRSGKIVPASERHLRKVRQHTGMVFQQYNLFPHMTAIRNVAEPLIRVKKVEKEIAYAEARDLLELVGLSSHGEKKPGQLSGGQQQRVALVRALAMKPKVMLFDEVTSALDPELVGELLRAIQDIASTIDMTMIVVTHEILFAAHISDRVLMFDEGRVIEQGHPDDILKSPKHERTQRFLSRLLDRG
jgi:polar amino acid transport system ATP-binding protein